MHQLEDHYVGGNFYSCGSNNQYEDIAREADRQEFLEFQPQAGIPLLEREDHFDLEIVDRLARAEAEAQALRDKTFVDPRSIFPALPAQEIPRRFDPGPFCASS